MDSSSSFDSTRVTGFGTSGQESAAKMSQALEEQGLSVAYDSDSRQFTVLGSSDLPGETVQKIFSECSYRGWEPILTGDKDEDGNHLVKLGMVMDESSKASSVVRSSFPHVKNRTRDDSARELVYNIEQHLEVSLDGKTCLDIGCRSGENALAMQEAGASVIGIEPDNSEFKVAAEKGMKKGQLIQATLQEFNNESGKKFDVATVFLWNIPFKEREGFVAALANVIHSDGCVIVGYADEPYDKDPYINVPKLMRTAFSKVVRREFPHSLNRYMLVCSNPRAISSKFS